MPTTACERPTREQIVAFKKDLAELMQKHHLGLRLYTWGYLKYEDLEPGCEVTLGETSTDFIDSV